MMTDLREYVAKAHFRQTMGKTLRVQIEDDVEWVVLKTDKYKTPACFRILQVDAMKRAQPKDTAWAPRWVSATSTLVAATAATTTEASL